MQSNLFIWSTKKLVSIAYCFSAFVEHRLKIANKLKMEKYQHFSSDITSHTVTVIPFEIGSHTGQINRENKLSLHTLHKYCKKDIKLKKFLDNISAISVLSSYYIFNCRNLESWATPDPIFAPFSNQWITQSNSYRQETTMINLQRDLWKFCLWTFYINLSMRLFNIFIVMFNYIHSIKTKLYAERKKTKHSG